MSKNMNYSHETNSEEVRNTFGTTHNILSGETPVPMDDNPKIILHVIPFTAFDISKKLPTSSLTEISRKIHPIFYITAYHYRYNLDGYLAYRDEPSDGYLQLFRNGIIEVVGRAASKEEKLIPAIDYGAQIHDSLPIYISALKDIGLSLILISIAY